jgi:tripartite-type tricarboxylate transporter receptor subunit TctC
MEEAGLSRPRSRQHCWHIGARGNTSDIIALLHREIVAVLALPDVKERLATLGFEIVASTPKEFAALIPKEIARWDKVVRDANIKVQ